MKLSGWMGFWNNANKRRKPRRLTVVLDERLGGQTNRTVGGFLDKRTAGGVSLSHSWSRESPPLSFQQHVSTSARSLLMYSFLPLLSGSSSGFRDAQRTDCRYAFVLLSSPCLRVSAHRLWKSFWVQTFSNQLTAHKGAQRVVPFSVACFITNSSMFWFRLLAPALISTSTSSPHV